MIITIQNEELEAKIDTHGAQLLSLISLKDEVEYIWQRDPAYWTDSAPVLFPVCGRLTGFRYLYGEREYPMPPHGFLKDSELALAGGGTRFADLTLEADAATERFFPFDFGFTIRFELFRRTLTVGAEVTNSGSSAMPFSYGAHPGFNLPLEPGRRFEDYYIEFEDGVSPTEIEITPSGYRGQSVFDFPLEGNRLRLSHSLFEKEGRFLRNAGHSVLLSCDGGNRSVRMTFPFAGTLGFWHEAGTEAPYLCIEPWLGTPDPEGIECEIMKKEDTVILLPGHSVKLVYTVSV